jgi:hypothetical protein
MSKLPQTFKSQAGSPAEDGAAVAQRLDQLERKLDDILSILHLLEGGSDLRWRGLDSALQHDEDRNAIADRFAALGAEFGATVAQRDRLWAARQRGPLDPAWTAELEASAGVELDPLLDRLFALAAALVALPASRDSELAIKAAAIQEFCEEGSDDIVHQLAASLAADLLRRKRTT